MSTVIPKCLECNELNIFPQAMPQMQPRLWLASGPPASFMLERCDYCNAPSKTALALAVCPYMCMFRSLIASNTHRPRKLSVTPDGDGDGEDDDGNDEGGDDDDGNGNGDVGDACRLRD